jgi:deazaflavin-dependent oxidoreductase (nitroreductase family)
VTNFDRDAWENGLIADMRAHNGEITTGPMAGRPILLMTAIGARSGEPRRVILNYTRDGDDYVIAGTKGGAPKDPIWVGNLRANPEVTVEAGGRTFPARATIVEDRAERDRLWDAHASAMPWFAEYPEMTGGRIIPMIRLTEVEPS